MLNDDDLLVWHLILFYYRGDGGQLDLRLLLIRLRAGCILLINMDVDMFHLLNIITLLLLCHVILRVLLSASSSKPAEDP